MEPPGLGEGTLTSEWGRAATLPLNSVCNAAKLRDDSGMRALLPLAVLGFSCLLNSVSAQGPTTTSPVVAEILKLSRAKVNEDVIVAYVQHAPRGNVSAADLLELHSNGISSRVLVALLNPNTPADAAQMAARTEVSPPIVQAQPTPQNVAASAPAVDSSNSAPTVVETPVVNYVSAPVYVGGGSIYYHEDAWWGIGLGWGYGWWGSCYPWYGYGWYPYYGFWGWGYYANCGYHHHHHHSDFDGDHGHGGHNWNNGHSWAHSRNGNVGRSTVARASGSPNNGMTASSASRSVSGTATPRSQATASRAGTSTATGSRNPANTMAGASRAGMGSGANTVTRSSTSAANARPTTAGAGQNGVARQGVTPSGGANRPAAVAGTRQQSPTMATRSVASPTRSAPSSFSPAPARTVTPRATGSPAMNSGYQGGGQISRNTYASAGSVGSYASARSFSAPSSMGSYSAARSYSGASSYSGGAIRGGYSGGGVSRGYSGGGGGGFRGGGFGGGGHGGGLGGGRR